MVHPVLAVICSVDVSIIGADATHQAVVNVLPILASVINEASVDRTR